MRCLFVAMIPSTNTQYHIYTSHNDYSFMEA